MRAARSAIDRSRSPPRTASSRRRSRRRAASSATSGVCTSTTATSAARDRDAESQLAELAHAVLVGRLTSSIPAWRSDARAVVAARLDQTDRPVRRREHGRTEQPRQRRDRGGPRPRIVRGSGGLPERAARDDRVRPHAGASRRVGGRAHAATPAAPTPTLRPRARSRLIALIASRRRRAPRCAPGPSRPSTTTPIAVRLAATSSVTTPPDDR